VAPTSSKWHRLANNPDEFPDGNPTNEPARLWLKLDHSLADQHQTGAGTAARLTVRPK
jgi:hypothetical protein